MTDVSQGPGWWIVSDGKWYPPEQHPNYLSPPPPPPGQVMVTPYSTPPPYQPGQVQSSTNGLAIASFVFSLLWIVGLGSLLAIIFALVARRQIRESRGTQGGGGLAVAGLVIGIVGLAGLVLTIVLAFAVTSAVVVTNQSAAVGLCRADALSVQTAVQAYQAQNGSYPPVLAPWGASTYVTNYATLTSSSSNGGPWLKVAPATSSYVVEFDSTGDVWVDGVGDYSGYTRAHDLNSDSNVCTVASP